jgi:hypothetical protein
MFRLYNRFREKARASRQGNSTYSPGLEKHRNIEEFLTAKSNRTCESRRRKEESALDVSFVRLRTVGSIRLRGYSFFQMCLILREFWRTKNKCCCPERSRSVIA